MPPAVVIAVPVIIGTVVLAALAYSLAKGCRARSTPLPPIGPLTHDRQRELEAATARWRTASSPAAPSLSSRTPSSSLPPSPSLHGSSSQTHLLAQPASPSSSSASLSTTPGPGTSARAYARRRTESTYSLSSTIRGAPHARHNRVEVILPTPLGPALPSAGALSALLPPGSAESLGADGWPRSSRGSPVEAAVPSNTAADDDDVSPPDSAAWPAPPLPALAY